MSSSSVMSRLLSTAVNRLVMSRLLSSGRITERGGRMIKISEEVSRALELKKPIVALESALVSCGLAYPYNFNEVKMLEFEVRNNGAVPAMIAILDGVACIGLSDEELRRFAGADVTRTAFRDIALVMAKRECGGTTVSATAFFAKLVGIPVVVAITDIASDMSEFGNTSVAVVCGGAESATDTPRMLEHLASVGTCVAAYQATTVIPFPDLLDEITLRQQELRYIGSMDVPPRAEPVKAPHCVESIEECVRLIEAHNELMMGKGILIAVPIAPTVKSAHGHSAYRRVVNEAWLKDMKDKEEREFTREKTKKIKHLLLAAYVAKVGAQIAVSLSTAG